ncbi:sigma-54-dependent Fis family transcriptional regulator [Paraburkholderia sp. D1E]|uniref:sigma-54-dependent Fis family transcriptional regulator n=1 Tax=Paraburkholderia sp. D1E TaxID=3461398 RepID=UPI004045481F
MMRNESPLSSESSQDARRVRRARDRVHAGEDADLSSVRPLILESWRRSRTAGVDPSWGVKGRLTDESKSGVTAASFVSAQEDRRLVDASTPILQLLSKALSDRASVLMLTDRFQRTAWLSTGNAVRNEAEFVNDIAGGQWLEQLVGTGSVALCHALCEPVQVHWYEHYTQGLDQWTGSSSPILDRVTGEVRGAVSVYGFGCIAHPKAFELTSNAGAIIESELILDEQRCRIQLLELYEAHISRFPNDPVVCVTRQGVIVGISAAACSALRLKGTDVRGKLLSSLPGIRLQGTASELISVKHPQTVDLQCGDDRLAAEIKPLHKQSDILGFLLTLKSPGVQPVARRRQVALWQANHRFDGLIGQSDSLLRSITSAKQIAQRDDAVLIVGETGTGKELFAHAVHAESSRCLGPFVSINCGGMDGELLRAELFGYEEGAFTGAARGGRQGKLELANHGTLFLDELEVMSTAMQVSLLRFLEEQTVVRIGADKPRPVDVRVVGATNLDLRHLVKTGQFRADLYHRLNVCTVRIPPLRERVEDIALLAEKILKQEQKTLDGDALQLLESYDWPGNIRELRNVLVHAALSSKGERIARTDIELADEQVVPSHDPDLLNDAELRVILSVLNRHDGKIEAAAAELNIHRVTLYRKLKRHGLKWSRGYS